MDFVRIIERGRCPSDHQRFRVLSCAQIPDLNLHQQRDDSIAFEHLPIANPKKSAFMRDHVHDEPDHVNHVTGDQIGGFSERRSPDRLVFRIDCSDDDPSWLICFHEPEEHGGNRFRWTEPVAMIRLEVPRELYEVVIDTGSLRGADCDFRFGLFWNSHTISRPAITASEGQIRFRVDPSLFVPQVEQRLTITSKPLNAENGRRQLGMPIRWIELTSLTRDHAALVGTTDQAKMLTFPKIGMGRRRWLKKNRAVMPTIPIWQVKLPSISARLLANSQSAASICPPCDQVVVAPVEVNSRHGTGLLIQYLINDFTKIATVASMRCYNDDRVVSAVHHYLPNPKLARHEIYQTVSRWFAEHPPKRAYVVPYFASDLLIAMALKDLFETQICLHVMDDNCLYGKEIPAIVMEQAIHKSDLCFAISPEMRGEYEQRFGARIWLLPPIVPSQLIDRRDLDLPLESSANKRTRWPGQTLRSLRRFWPSKRSRHASAAQRGILIGNVWDRHWLDLLRKTIRESGLEVDWYSNNPEAVWLQDSTRDLANDGVHLHPALWGQDLVSELRRRPFALMPSGMLGQGDARESIARLSLPSRVPFVVATSGVPIVVLGSPETSAAKFVERFSLGTVIDYDGAALRRAAQQVVQSNVQQSVRAHARSIADPFSNRGLEQWLWSSLDCREPRDDRFESLFGRRPGDFNCFFATRPPPEIHWAFRSTWQMLHRLRAQGVNPEIVIDVGASTGVWSWTAATVFPKARFVLVDPMTSRYDEGARRYYQKALHQCDVIEAALGDHCGHLDMLVSSDLYGSSLLKVDDTLRNNITTQVEVLTLDDLARRINLRGSTLLKIDVQFAEHLVLAGGRNYISNHVEALVLELTLQREHPQAKTYREMLDLMERMGYELLDETEGWRSPKDGRLEQKDSVFVRSRRGAMSKVA